MTSNSNPCPCGRPRPYEACCGLLHRALADSGQGAPDAEALMRSRYSAYVLELQDYLLATWHVSTRPAQLEGNEHGLKWLGLEVKPHKVQDADHATVEFIARSKLGGRAHRMHEVSRFVRENGFWFYLDAQT